MAKNIGKRIKAALLACIAFARDGENQFLTTLPEGLRSDPSLADVKDVGTLAQRFVDTKRLVGMDKIALPKDPNDPHWNAPDGVWSKLGRPAKWEDYKTGLPKMKFPEGFALDEAGVDSFLQAAHKMGMPASMVNGMYQMHAESQAKAFSKILSDYENETNAAATALKQEFGKDYDVKLQRTNRLVAWAAGGDKELTNQIASLIGRNPAALRVMSKIADAISDDVIGDGGPKPGVTKDEMAAKIRELEASPAWRDANHPEHKAVIDQLTELYSAMEK